MPITTSAAVQSAADDYNAQESIANKADADAFAARQYTITARQQYAAVQQANADRLAAAGVAVQSADANADALMAAAVTAHDRLSQLLNAYRAAATPDLNDPTKTEAV